MESIRIGNDIELFWSIFNKSDLTAYNLEGRDLKVYLSSFCGKEEINDFTVSENVLIMSSAEDPVKYAFQVSRVISLSIIDVSL